MSISSYAQWVQDTGANILSPRSPKLKALDQAIQQYERTKNEKRSLEGQERSGRLEAL